MREQLNSNPMVQAAVIAVLLLGTAFFLMSSMGGGEESSETGVTATTITEGLEAPVGGAPPVPPAALAATAPPPPGDVIAAFDANRTVVLLFVRNSGIDDRLVKGALHALAPLSDVATFVVSVNRIARYSAITEGVDVNRVPALVVIRPKRLAGPTPTASVKYGFQSPESIVQAVIDAGYKGRTLDYHP